jgi:hypothetical protein
MTIDIKRFEKCIGLQIEGAITDNEKVTHVYLEENKVYCVIDDSYEALFDCLIIDLVNGGEFVRLK